MKIVLVARCAAPPSAACGAARVCRGNLVRCQASLKSQHLLVAAARDPGRARDRPPPGRHACARLQSVHCGIRGGSIGGDGHGMSAGTAACAVSKAVRKPRPPCSRTLGRAGLAEETPRRRLLQMPADVRLARVLPDAVLQGLQQPCAAHGGGARRAAAVQAADGGRAATGHWWRRPALRALLHARRQSQSLHASRHHAALLGAAGWWTPLKR